MSIAAIAVWPFGVSAAATDGLMAMRRSEPWRRQHKLGRSDGTDAIRILATLADLPLTEHGHRS